MKMTRNPFANNPFLLGFEEVERLIDRAAKSGNDGYPPYNIEEHAENAYRITLAVAGFSEGDLSVSVEDRQLIIRGQQQDTNEDRVFLHRGIATRQFQRSFILAEGVDISGARMENGLLHIDLTRIEPEQVVRKIKITTR